MEKKCPTFASQNWLSITPELTISKLEQSVQEADIPKTLIDQQAQQMGEQGYLHFPPLFREEEIQPLRLAIQALETVGLPAAYIYVFDEAWELFAKLRPLISHFLGEDFRLLPNFWAWNINPEKGYRGWPAHQDCQAKTRFDDGLGGDLLMSLSLWIPLTDANQDNGCMYVLPRPVEQAYDPPLSSPDQIRETDGLALPAKAGSVLGWPQDLYHWSGLTTGQSQNPRISLSLEFQNPAFAPLREPLLFIDQPPSLPDRLALIHDQFPRYRHMEKIDFDPKMLPEIIRRMSN